MRTIPLFKTGDRFTSKLDNRQGTVDRLRSDRWEIDNNWKDGKYNYSVTYDDGSSDTYLAESFMISQTNALLYCDTSIESNCSGYCKYRTGDKVSVSNHNIMITYPTFGEQYIKYRTGVIERVYKPTKYNIYKNMCLYKIYFDDGSVGDEIPEFKINNLVKVQYDDILIVNPTLTKSTNSLISDLTLLNTLNSQVYKNSTPKTQLVSSLFSQTEDYQDINEDKELQEEVIKFYHKKTLKWLEKNEEFKKSKKHLKFIKSKKGINYVKTMLKSYIKKYEAKWYELRSEENYSDVKEFIRKTLSSL